MNAVAEAQADAPALDGITAQLFRYAQDMGELMQQHKQLEEQHRMVLMSLGREVPTDHLPTTMLAQVAPLYWVTTAQGNLLRANAAAQRELDLQGVMVPGSNMAQLISAAQRPKLKEMLDRFAAGGLHAPGLQWRLHMAALPDAPEPSSYDVVAMQIKQNGRFEIYWFLRKATEFQSPPLQMLSELVSAADSDQALMLAKPFGTICAINNGGCAINGYDANEILGNNPRMFSSGRHDSAFFQDFWLELLGKGSWNGTIFNRRKDGQIYLAWQVIKMIENADGEVIAYLSALADLSHTDPANKRLQTLAYSDPLTGLPNRRMLVERITENMGTDPATSPVMALLFVDLNRFKPINDELGHEMGDLVLQEVARRMGSALEPEDMLARVGGDEFVILLCGPHRTHLAQTIAENMEQALRPSMSIHGHHVSISASMGCSHYPRDARDMNELLKHADTAMYAAKRFDMPFCLYSPDLEARDHVNLEFDLWQALERDEISLVYQPQFRSRGGSALRGCEALMRWKHSVIGPVEPAVFISLAEKCGAIVPLGNWALVHACEQLRAWRAQGMEDMTLSVNVSQRQLRDPGFLALVEHTLRANELPPHLLEMELSENQAVMFADHDTRPIQALRQMGVRIAIDDFGISFNSLTRLNALSVSSLKINAQCVHELSNSADARAISNCMIAIGEAMGIEVIAQGVESEAQATLLSQQGCRVIQGFYSGHPVSAAAMTHMVKAI